jgi:hypothetical protein
MHLGNAKATLANAQPHPPWRGGPRARLVRPILRARAGSGVIELRQWTDLFFCSEPHSVLCIPFPG